LFIMIGGYFYQLSLYRKELIKNPKPNKKISRATTSPHLE
jgi:uncharacterized protein YneF (UPF0154 family)